MHDYGPGIIVRDGPIVHFRLSVKRRTCDNQEVLPPTARGLVSFYHHPTLFNLLQAPPFYLPLLTSNHHHGCSIPVSPPSETGPHLRGHAKCPRYTSALHSDHEEEIRWSQWSSHKDSRRKPWCAIRSCYSGRQWRLDFVNQQEIAIRVFRTAHELAMHTVAIYSFEDRLSAHRQKVLDMTRCLIYEILLNTARQSGR
jgi:hypothetical protein